MLRLKMNAKNKKAKMCKGKIITMDERKMYEGRDEVDLVALMLSVAHKYRQIIAAALIGALLLGGLNIAKSFLSKRTVETASVDEVQTQIADADKEYEQELIKYYTEKSEYDKAVNEYTDQLRQIQIDQKKAEADIQNLNQYAEKSVLINLNPDCVYTENVELSVSNDYKIIPEMGYQDPDYIVPLLDSYVKILSGHDTMNPIAGQIGIEERYLEELVEISADTGAHALSISVISDSMERSKAIMEALLTRQENVKETVEQAIGTHEVKQLTSFSGVTVQDSVRDTQSAFRVGLAGLEKNKDALQDAYDLAMQNLETEKRNLAVLKFPEKSSGIGSVVKYAVLGAILGIVVVMGCATVRFISGGKASSAGELCRYSGVPVLGRLAGEATQKQKGLDAWLNKLERRPNGGENEETIRLIAALVRNLEPDAETVLLTGDLPAEQMQALCGKLQASPGMSGKKVTASACVLSSAQAVEQVVASDVVLLVADCTRTCIVDFQMQSDRIQKLGKKVFGCVVFE